MISYTRRKCVRNNSSKIPSCFELLRGEYHQNQSLPSATYNSSHTCLTRSPSTCAAAQASRVISSNSQARLCAGPPIHVSKFELIHEPAASRDISARGGFAFRNSLTVTVAR